MDEKTVKKDKKKIGGAKKAKTKIISWRNKKSRKKSKRKRS